MNTIAVGPAGICVGSPIAEGPPNIHLFEPDFATTRWLAPRGWHIEQPGGANLADGRWHRVALARQQAERRQQLYVDGQRVATRPGAQGGGHSGASRLDRANTGGAFLGGGLDEFRLYARCLTAAQVQALATMASPHAARAAPSVNKKGTE